MLRRRNLLRRGLNFGNSDHYGHIAAGHGHSGGGYEVGNYDYTKSDYGHSDYGHSYSSDGYGHSGGGGYGHSSGGHGHGHHGGGYHDSTGYGHNTYSYGHEGGYHAIPSYHAASYGSYGKMDCPGIPIALLLTTLLGIGILGFILFTKIQGAGRRRRSTEQTSLAAGNTTWTGLLADIEDLITILSFGRSPQNIPRFQNQNKAVA